MPHIQGIQKINVQSQPSSDPKSIPVQNPSAGEFDPQQM